MDSLAISLLTVDVKIFVVKIHEINKINPVQNIKPEFMNKTKGPYIQTVNTISQQ